MRAAAITSAQREREHSEDAARRAASLEKQIRQMTQDNHFAEMIARQILRNMP
jgi:hypothetical protein